MKFLAPLILCSVFGCEPGFERPGDCKRFEAGYRRTAAAQLGSGLEDQAKVLAGVCAKMTFSETVSNCAEKAKTYADMSGCLNSLTNEQKLAVTAARKLQAP